MRIVVAPDKFKGCLTAVQVAAAMSDGLRRADPDCEIDACPMADGGEGTVEALVAATHGRFETFRVTGPLPDMRVDARLGILGDGKTAVIEMSAASGLHLLSPADRDPMRTTTFGTGELLVAAAKLGVSKIILGIGGSATIDGGIGCAQACGLPVILDGGDPVAPTEPLVGADLARVVLVKHGRGGPVERVTIEVASDVSNPLFGPNGAAAVYGPQKGATPEQIRQLDADLRRLAERTGNLEIANQPGAGAAGGLGFALAAFFGARISSGIELVMDAAQLRRRLAGAALCLTGEGRLDRQTLSGKTVIGVARMCQSAGVPCIAITGSVDPGITWRDHGIEETIAIRTGQMTLQEAMDRAGEWISTAAQNIALQRRP